LHAQSKWTPVRLAVDVIRRRLLRVAAGRLAVRWKVSLGNRHVSSLIIKASQLLVHFGSFAHQHKLTHVHFSDPSRRHDGVRQREEERPEGMLQYGARCVCIFCCKNFQAS